MFLNEYVKYSRQSQISPESPQGLFIFITELFSFQLPTQVVPSQTTPLTIYLKFFNKLHTSNILFSQKYEFTIRPAKIVLKLPIMTVLSQNDELYMQVHLLCGQSQSIISTFNFPMKQTNDISSILTGQLEEQEFHSKNAKLRGVIASHQLLSYPPNFIFNCNEPPNFLIQQGWYKFNMSDSEHWINATMINKPRNKPFYKVKLQDYAVVFSNFNRRIGLESLHNDIKDAVIDSLVQAVELANDVNIDRQSISFNIDRYILQVTSHTGLMPLTKKQFQVTNKPHQTNFDANAYDLFSSKSDVFTFSSSSSLVFEFVVQLSIFIGGASSQQIIEPFQDALTYTICWGTWSHDSGQKVNLNQQKPFSENALLKIEDLDAQIHIIIESEPQQKADTSNLINIELVPPEIYFQDKEKEQIFNNMIEFDSQEFNEIKFIENAHVQITETTQIQHLQAQKQYPVSAKLRVYSFQPLIQNYFRDTVKIRFFARSSQNEILQQDSSYTDITFSNQITIDLFSNFKGVMTSLYVQLIDRIDGIDYVIGQQKIPISNTQILEKCKADAFIQDRNNQFSQHVLDENFFDLLILEAVGDSYFDQEPPEIAVLQIQIQLINSQYANYDNLEDKGNIMTQQELFQAAVLKKLGDYEKYLVYQQTIKNAFFTPQRMLAISKIGQNSIYRHYVIQNNQELLLDILYDLKLNHKNVYKLSLISPDPLQVSAVNFTISFEKLNQFENIGNIEDLKLKFSLSSPKKVLFSRIKFVFSLHFNDQNLGHIHVVFDVVKPLKSFSQISFLIAFPYKNQQTKTIIIRRLGPDFILISPNCNGIFLPNLEEINSKKSIQNYHIYNQNNLLDININVMIKEQFEFILVEFTPEILNQFQKTTTKLVLKSQDFSVDLNISLMNYCDVQCETGDMLQIPKFSEKKLFSYPPHDSGSIRILSIQKQYVRSIDPKYLVDIIPQESTKIIKKYFLKSKGNDLKYLIYSDHMGDIQSYSEFPSLVRTRKCRISDEGWMIPIQINMACSNHRQSLRIYVVSQSMFMGYFLLEIQWE
ncbi:hypothetical protein SS50377_27651 [Spironucleus salmonicida]|uniref:Uncharacterized protein n=1 Tax=Spironucleus salmonicida TaxID=348837 RepID=V6LPG7_9EUKA|nr:hypothetical protein SS50377_27651 [Spironucleus salmonicida]|eukprot:EST46572.1 Hypothetical protein SS50377_13376 [Spironucleus salmonicida]